MAGAKVILIAAPEFIPALRERVGEGGVLTFADSDPVRAMDAISADRPPVVALERLFAASPRGAALIARIKENPNLEACEIRILSHDSRYQRVSPRKGDTPPAKKAAKPARAFDRGTRRWPRFKIRESAVAAVDGHASRVIELSLGGVHLIGPESLRAKQKVTVRFGAAERAFDVAGTVVWARMELSRRGPAARVGIQFTNPDAGALTKFLEESRVR